MRSPAICHVILIAVIQTDDNLTINKAENNSPPVAHKDFLIENCSIRAEEGHGVEGVWTERVLETHMVCLTLLLRVCIVTSEGEAIAGEGGLLNTCQDGIVHSWLSWDGVSQPIQRIIPFFLNTKAQ